MPPPLKLTKGQTKTHMKNGFAQCALCIFIFIVPKVFFFAIFFFVIFIKHLFFFATPKKYTPKTCETTIPKKKEK